MSDFRVASRYAKSLLSLSIEQKIEDKLMDDMALITDTCFNSRDLIIVLKNPIIKYDRKLSILKKIFEGKVDKLVIRFIELLARKNRANILPEIAKTWMDMYHEFKNIVTTQVTSAITLSTDEKNKILNAVEKSTGKKVILEEKVNQELIGGFVLNIKDQQLDNSVSGQIKQLKRKLLTRV